MNSGRVFASVVMLSMAAAAHQGCSSQPDAEAPVTDAGAIEAAAADASATANDAGVDGPRVDSSDAESADATSEDAADASADADGDALAQDAALACPSDAGVGLPNDLRCSGLYADWSTKTLAAGVRAYTPGYQSWSDGALKSRFVYLPPGTQIDNSDVDEWTFPTGATFWKEFRLGTQRIETRIYKKLGAFTWVSATYRWSSDELTATRLDAGELNVNGTGYEVPSKGQCTLCHQGRNDRVLGFDAISLGASSAQGITLATLLAEGLLTKTMPQSIEIPNDSTGLARQPFGWLHANCGTSCHNRNTDALASATGLWLRVNAKHLLADAGAPKLRDLDPYVTSVNAVPIDAQFAGQGYKRILPGDPNKSLIPLFDGTRGDPNVPQMPPIATHVVPTNDVAALKNWISAMPTDGGL